MKRALVGFVLVLAFVHILTGGVRSSDPRAVEAIIALEGTTVKYVGKINEENVDRLLDLVAAKPVTELIISTSGGEINGGMTMGEWVYNNNIDVVVEGMCMSSGANYVFTAGRIKTIREGSVVAWHGSILQKSVMSVDDIRATTKTVYEQLPEDVRAQFDLETLIEQTIRDSDEYVAKSKVRQAQFYEKIGVDEYLTRVGNEEYGAEDFFTMSVEDMAHFGIRDVTAPADYEEVALARGVDFITIK
ncbi:MAG: hypothetical protein M0R49_08975 [Limnochordia bacterium]|jgi:hypothetical protein|nr:hypothetical protein [Limnochordia bacterium]